MATPALLLQSKSELHPNGVGNSQDLVGRHLMRHLIDFYFVRSPSKKIPKGHLIELAISDFVGPQRQHWGVINVAAELMPVHLMAQEFLARIKTQYFLPIPTRPAVSFVKWFLKRITFERLLATPIIEDSPNFDNRVCLNPDGNNLKVEYSISKADQVRLSVSRKYFKIYFNLGK